MLRRDRSCRMADRGLGELSVVRAVAVSLSTLGERLATWLAAGLQLPWPSCDEHSVRALLLGEWAIESFQHNLSSGCSEHPSTCVGIGGLTPKSQAPRHWRRGRGWTGEMRPRSPCLCRKRAGFARLFMEGSESFLPYLRPARCAISGAETLDGQPGWKAAEIRRVSSRALCGEIQPGQWARDAEHEARRTRRSMQRRQPRRWPVWERKAAGLEPPKSALDCPRRSKARGAEC